ncbi:kit ligand-like [Acanthochromis polyacanthus]|uniref:kit ligand-like n=1 Tax=Acanthochromis polyacanthus TaxID=80966 RepID=UPI002234DB9A|nr:kit ligand-like [Acanthochromis polyacanthus]
MVDCKGCCFVIYCDNVSSVSPSEMLVTMSLCRRRDCLLKLISFSMQSWIHICVCFLLFIMLGVHSNTFDVSPVTDDISKLYTLKQNIPKDYKIPVRYIPKQECGMCWVKLNIYPLEASLQDLAHKFGNISSNRNDIGIFILILQDLRLRMDSVEPIMFEFECHYREERWPTERYFDFVKDFLTAAQNKEDSDDCDPPPCPTTPYTVITEYSKRELK